MKALVALAICAFTSERYRTGGSRNGWTPWGGGTNCFLANVNDLEVQQP